MQADARLILAGGGDSQPLDELFAAWTGPDGRMLFLPVALDVSAHEGYLEVVKSEVTAFGVSNIEMWSDLLEHDPSELAAFDSVYLGGGSTFRLLAHLRDSGLDSALISHARQGGVIYGCSAGADVLGRDIMTVVHAESNDIGLTDTRGLDMVPGHAIWTHYVPEHEALVADYWLIMYGSGESLSWLSPRGQGSLYSEFGWNRWGLPRCTGSMKGASKNFGRLTEREAQGLHTDGVATTRTQPEVRTPADLCISGNLAGVGVGTTGRGAA